ncbi:hypothetical protein FRC10_004301 [Ceratobasidium sp. 414]|nr:hypothetical protein FRC10_004301 [Ceratobasidium sp. 414]
MLNGAAGNYFGGNALPSVTSTSIEAEVPGGANAPHPAYSFRKNDPGQLALRQAINEDACTPDVLLALLSELPPKDDIAVLFDIYFCEINPVRFPLPENDIRRAFDDLNAFTWGPPREDGDNNATHILFLPLLFMIIATTTYCPPLTMSKRIDVKSQAKRYYHSYRRAASMASLLPATTTLVCAHLLAARFLIIIRTPADGWSLLGATLRLAHPQPPPIPTPALGPLVLRQHEHVSDARQTDGRRVGDCDVLPPSSVKLDEDAEDEVGEHRLAHVAVRVIEHFQDLAGGRHYDTVIELDQQLVAFSESLPALYKPDGGERLRELLERGWTSHDHSKDRETTNGTEETADDAQERPADRLWVRNPGRIFYAMVKNMIPHEPLASTLPESTDVVEKYLNVRWSGLTVVPAFIQIHANQAAHDVTSARELKIIQLFRTRADDALRLRSPMKPGSAPQMMSQLPNQITTAPRPPRSSRGFTTDSPFPTSANQSSPPHGHRRPRSTTSASSMSISTPNVIDNPPLPPGVLPTTSFALVSFGSPTTTFSLSNNQWASNATISPATPREAQGLSLPAPKTVSPLLMLGMGANADGTPPSNFNALPFTDALFDQVSWRYALANQGMSLGFN